MQDDNIPLADKLRPTHLDQIVGQEHLTGKGKLLDRLVAEKQTSSLIFWGPPGSGKTTIARILANEALGEFVELSAVSTNKKEVMQVIDRAAANRRLGSITTLFIDEIHRFNKAQQDAFLPYVENGTIRLIGATTENPSFEVISALLSRCRVVVLNPLNVKDIKKLLTNASSKLKLSSTTIPVKSLSLIAQLSNGDARTALNILDLSLRLANKGPVSQVVVENAAQHTIAYHDKSGDSHYNLISALIKSLRASDESASFYYLARLLQAGEDPKFIARRMIIFASEDIGLAASAALNLAVSTFLAVERIGLPECSYNLFHCAAILAKAPKSRLVTEAMSKAKTTASNYPNLDVPNFLKNAPTKLMKDLKFNEGYKWEAGFKDSRKYLPKEIENIDFFKD